MDEQDEIPAQGQEKTHSPPKRKGATLDLRWPCSAGGSHKLSGSNQNLSARAPESITMMGATSWEQRTMDSMAQERGEEGAGTCCGDGETSGGCKRRIHRLGLASGILYPALMGFGPHEPSLEGSIFVLFFFVVFYYLCMPVLSSDTSDFSMQYIFYIFLHLPVIRPCVATEKKINRFC